MVLPETLIEDGYSVDIVWSACSRAVLLLSPTGCIFAYDAQCVELLAVQALDWMPQKALSSCLKIIPFTQQSNVEKLSNSVFSMALHIIMECGDIGTLQLSAERYNITEKSHGYKNQEANLLNFELFSDIAHECLSNAGFGSGERLWSVDNSSWLPRSQILLLLCKAKRSKKTGILGKWAPFQADDSNTLEKLSVFALKLDPMAVAKKKFNPKASSWSLLDLQPSSVDCLPTIPPRGESPGGSPDGSAKSTTWSLWGNSSWNNEELLTHGIRKIVIDPAEE